MGSREGDERRRSRATLIESDDDDGYQLASLEQACRRSPSSFAHWTVYALLLLTTIDLAVADLRLTLALAALHFACLWSLGQQLVCRM